jgi:hypothetical protein
VTVSVDPAQRLQPRGRRRPRDVGIRVGIVVVAPVAAYGLSRPIIGSDAAALAVAGAIPLLYNMGRAVWRRRIDLLGVFSAVTFGLGCAGSLLIGGSSLPLKLTIAPVTFLVGVVLLIAVLIRRPFPLGRLLRVPPTQHIDSALGALIGGFLMLHALLHLALAMLLSTESYVVASRVIDWGTLGIGYLALRAYVRQFRRDPRDTATARL